MFPEGGGGEGGGWIISELRITIDDDSKGIGRTVKKKKKTGLVCPHSHK